MGILTPPGLKIYRNIYVKDFTRFPYQKLTGRNTLMYRGKILYVTELPADYDPKKDIYFSCDCDYPEWKTLKRIL